MLLTFSYIRGSIVKHFLTDLDTILDIILKISAIAAVIAILKNQYHTLLCVLISH